MTDTHAWHPYKDGATLGAKGSESGVIVRDEVTAGALITIEQCTYPPYAITCGAAGMVHTVYASTLEEATRLFEEMQEGLTYLVDLAPYNNDPDLRMRLERLYEAIEAFVNRF